MKGWPHSRPTRALGGRPDAVGAVVIGVCLVALCALAVHALARLGLELPEGVSGWIIGGRSHG